MEDFSRELMVAITEFYEDEELVRDILSYLYHNTNDVELETEIVNWFNATDRCLDCGTKLVTYEFTETHTELDFNRDEPYIMRYCPICDKDEIIALKTERR